MRFAGVENYRRLVFDPQFLTSIWLTLKFAFFVVVSELVLGYLLAQLLMRDFPAQGAVPHDPHPAADGGADRGRRHLAAAHACPASARSPTIWSAGSASSTGSAPSPIRRS